MMEIERQWGHAPGWFLEQDRATRNNLVAWYSVHVSPAGKT